MATRPLSAIEIVAQFPQRYGDVDLFRLLTYAPRPELRERTAASDLIVASARFPPEATDFEFWEFVASKVRTNAITDIVSAMVDHDAESERVGITEVRATRLDRDFLDAVRNNIPSGSVLAICSRCTDRRGREVHIPLLDLRCPPSPENERILGAALTRVHAPGGLLLESGRSYHFYGKSQLNPDEWRQFMARALLLHPFVDSRYVAHRLLAGQAVLRVSTCPRKPTEPRLVGQL